MEHLINQSFWGTRLSKTVYISRFFAILSVITAHCKSSFDNYIIEVFSNVGTVGVGVFFFCSGVYFNTKLKCKDNVKKLLFLLIPWLLSSTVIWFEVNLRKHDFSFASWFNHFIGVGSIFYFFTVYFVYIIFTMLYIKLSDKSVSQVKVHFILFLICFSFTFISCILENNSISLFPTPYLNPLLFASYYSLGLFFNYNKDKLIVFLHSKWSLLVVFGGLTLFIPFDLYYWNYLYSFLEIIYILAILKISYILYVYLHTFSFINVMILIGKSSLFIYIWHLLPVTLLNYFGVREYYLNECYLLWPCFVLLLFLFVIKVLLKLDSGSYIKYLGLR